MNLGAVLRYFLLRTPDRYAASSLRIHEFTVLLSVDDGEGAAKILDDQDRTPERLYGAVPGVHHLRWYLFEPTQKTGDKPREKPTALVFSVIFDGDTDDLLDGLMHHAREPVLQILRLCRGFSEGSNVAEFLKARRIESGFLFRDLGTLAGPHDDPDYEGDASVSEIDEARAVQSEFEKFYDANFQERSAEELRRKFLAAFADRRTTLPLTRFERALKTEARYVRKVIELNRRTQDQERLRARLPLPLRGQHAKGHALVRATFQVARDLDPRFRHGVFAEPGAVFDACIRPSNGSPGRQADSAPDARGVALRLEIDATGAPWPRARGEAPKHQDFLLFSHPTFFAPDIKAFTVLMSIFQTGTSMATKLPKGLAYAVGSGKFSMLAGIVKTLLHKVRHPLAWTFHSATPYLLGQDTAVKYAVEPRAKAALDAFASDTRDPDFRRKALAASLAAGPIELDLYAYAYAAAAPAEEVRDAIEDATIDWTGRQTSLKYGLGRWRRPRATKVHLGTVTLPQLGEMGQLDPMTDEAMRAAEERQFNPWNGLAAHRPLGSLNRARWFIYRDSAARRARAGDGASAAAAPERAEVQQQVV